MLRRLEDIENASTSGPVTLAARAALASSVIAHAVDDLQHGIIVEADVAHRVHGVLAAQWRVARRRSASTGPCSNGRLQIA